MKIEWIENHLREAVQLIQHEDVHQGLSILNNLLYEEPGYGNLHNHIGWAHLYYAEDPEKAELHLKTAIRFDLDYAPPYLHLGTLYVRLGRYNEAIEILQQGVTKAHANKIACQETIGQAYELKKQYSLAIKSYKEALFSSIGYNAEDLHEGIKRCRKKRWAMMLNF